MNIEEESIQLISEEQNKFYLSPQAKKWLSSLDKPLSIITIAGAYRSGKSYLVNRLLKNRNSGFATGASIQPVTKGLNIWSRPIPAHDQTGKEFLYLVLDSEGVGSCEQQTKYDSKLLALVCLISSTVIYNSQGAIDEGTLDQLRIVAKLKQCLKGTGTEDKGRLVWVLRDFALQLVGKNGSQLSPDEYLQMCLQQTPSSNSEIRKKNEIRRGIKQTFTRRKCFTLVRPTINEQDLRNLDKCRPRAQFLQGIQTIRQTVFSGSREDIKSINGSLINGRLLVSLLQECLNQLNSSKMPQIKMIWELISECANQENYQKICKQMKQQLNRICLPLFKQELKAKLNQIQNRAYNRLEKQFHSINQFKKYHKQLLHQIQKMNKEMKKNNAQMLKEKTLKELRIFTNNNIDIQSIEPTNLSVLKLIVERMQLKIRGEPQGYEYALSVLFDILQISEHKSQRAQREAAQRLKALQSNTLQRRASDQTIASLRHDYHQALKTISNLKVSQQSCEKQAALLKQKLEMMQNHCKSVQQQSEIKVQELIRQLEQNGQRTRQRAEESVQLTKRLRDQNAQLQRELEALKQQRLREGLNERKEIIFEEKMKETWDKFQQQRIFFRKEVQKLRRSSQANLKLYQQQRRAREKQGQQFKRQKQILMSRQKQYLQQLNEIKTMHAQTKKTYSATFDAFKDNDRIFKCIENVPPKTATSKKVTQQIEGIRKQYQSQLQKTKSDYEGQLKQLKIELSKVNSSSHHQRLRLSDQQSRCHSLTMQKQRLQRQLQSANLRLTDTLSQIEAAKQRQRSLYQQSIVRLLNNFQKRQYSSQSNFYRR